MRDVLPPDGAATPTSSEVLRAARMLGAVIERQVSGEDLTLDDWLVLAALADSPGLTMAELRTQTQAAAPTLTRVVDRLAGRALVFREVDADDRRKVRVNLSKRGAALHTRLLTTVRPAEQAWFDQHGVSQWMRAGS
ncbi:transcriptional regulator [Mycolicibacterium conceptionense]|uniref:MarR family transcriptional regulator n=1 Tax=Mycolicibacterium TaxID=1866885 RepID=UPI0007ED5B0D|nr:MULTISPECIES: MarR family transcriptional regulator [Mycolicibacterium]OBK06207.1 transcriptional regulator [Mycolicibacterium conceptionense]OMB69893.1 transcriptional regulator [Mycolicibacterium conceptionense]OMB83532.1 transcriptional regulator [Mycolicibacterium conceptionense]QZH57819.1 MarR family transcriptional regulator [Mycolicibacterium farcinogenes]